MSRRWMGVSGSGERPGASQARPQRVETRAAAELDRPLGTLSPGKASRVPLARGLARGEHSNPPLAPHPPLPSRAPAPIAIDELRFRAPAGSGPEAERIVRAALDVVQREWGGEVDARRLEEIRLSIPALTSSGAVRLLAARILRSLESRSGAGSAAGAEGGNRA